MEQYTRGQSITSTVTFRDAESGDPADPDTVIFSTKVGPAAQASIVWTAGEPDARIEHVDTGVFRTIVFLGDFGAWSRAWQGILDDESAFVCTQFNVLKTPITPTAP